MIKTRFAPSPTGYMHLGSLRACLLPYCFAKQANGKFLFRIDDTDLTRSKDEYVEDIKKNLEWLQINWDENFTQSSRIEQYDAYFELLKEKGYIYPCYENKDQLTIFKSRKSIFNKSDRFEKIGEVYWRFELRQNSYIINDLILGTVTFNRDWSDPIIKKPDGSYSYIFCSVLDDIDSNITHIIRGSEHISNAAIQQELGNIICQIKNNQDWKINWAHFSLLIEKDGSKMSKRSSENSLLVKDLREIYEPHTFWSIFISLGTSKQQLISVNTDEYIKYFDLNSYSSSLQKFDFTQIEKTNKKIIPLLSDGQIVEKYPNINLKIWHLLKNNINTMNEFFIMQTHLNQKSQKYNDFLKSQINPYEYFQNKIDMLDFYQEILGVKFGPKLDILVNYLRENLYI